MDFRMVSASMDLSITAVQVFARALCQDKHIMWHRVPRPPGAVDQRADFFKTLLTNVDFADAPRRYLPTNHNQGNNADHVVRRGEIDRAGTTRTERRV